jgi:hypothetical protein
MLKTSGDSPEAAAIREAIGAGPDEKVTIMTPQFDRSPNLPPLPGPPSLPTEWDALRALTRKELHARGLRSWDGRLMLFPAEWYSAIPEGFAIESIMERAEKFRRGVTSNDRRMGFLAFGIPAVDGKITVPKIRMRKKRKDRR